MQSFEISKRQRTIYEEANDEGHRNIPCIAGVLHSKSIYSRNRTPGGQKIKSWPPGSTGSGDGMDSEQQVNYSKRTRKSFTSCWQEPDRGEGMVLPLWAWSRRLSQASLKAWWWAWWWAFTKTLTGFIGENPGRDPPEDSSVVEEVGQVGRLLAIHLGSEDEWWSMIEWWYDDELTITCSPSTFWVRMSDD